MVVVWVGLALIGGIAWAWVSISQKRSGDRHQRKARESASTGNWERAAVSCKLAILSRFDAETKLRELTRALSDLYRTRGLQSDLGPILECSQILKTLRLGTGNQTKKNELIGKLYKETGDFLDGLPGPSLPDR